MLTGWYVGHVVAAVVIAVVAVLVAGLLSLVRSIDVETRSIVARLGAIREATQPLPAVGKLNETLASVVNRAAVARSVVEGRS